jgi:predicted ATP-dependent endonuclease of OLD family
MHGTAQAKIVEFLEKLSLDNQTLYTTHSPFLISGDHLERARAVYEGEDGTTRISEDVWPRDRDSLFPLQAALGYQLVQSLFIAKRQVLVEGISDLWILNALAVALGARSIPTLRPDIRFVPSAGVSKLLPLASLLTGHDIALAALLDGDEPGRREGKKLVEKLLAGEDRKCLFIGDFIDNPQAEIEDVFAEQEYLTAVSEAYDGLSLDFTKAERALVGVVNKVEAFFKRKETRFEKWRPAAVLRDRVLAAPGSVADTTCDVARRMFEALNALFPEEAK